MWLCARTVYPVLLAPWQIFSLTHAWCCHTYSHKWLETHDYRFTVVREIQLAEIQIFSLLVWDSRALAWTQLVSLPASLSFSVSLVLTVSPIFPHFVVMLDITCSVSTAGKQQQVLHIETKLRWSAICVEHKYECLLLWTRHTTAPTRTFNSYKALLCCRWRWINIHRSELYSKCSVHFCVCRLTNRQEGIREPISHVQADLPMHIYHLTFIFVVTLFTFV